MKVILGVLIPFIGTIIGALLVFFMKKEINKKIEIIIYGFAAGVMMAALIWSLIIPAIESASVIPVVIGLILGVSTFYLIDLYVNRKDERLNNLMVAVTLHNIPEGMAVGVTFAGALLGQKASKGVFITTSSFTKEAEEYVSSVDRKVVLIDGTKLATLMIEHNVGISTVRTFEIKRIDSDYFEG